MRKSDLGSKTFNRCEEFPEAIDKNKVGSYPHDVEFGGGVYYDDVLEYRVWSVNSLRAYNDSEISPDSEKNHVVETEDEAFDDRDDIEENYYVVEFDKTEDLDENADKNGDAMPSGVSIEDSENLEDRVYCFPTYAAALEFFEEHNECDEPVALVLQREYIDNAHENFLVHMKKTRMVEWDVEQLLDHQRSETSIREYFCGKSQANRFSGNGNAYKLNSVNAYLEARNSAKKADFEPVETPGQSISDFISEFATDEAHEESLGEFLRTTQSIRLSYMTRRMLNFTYFRLIGIGIVLATVMFLILGELFGSLFPSSMGFARKIIVFLMFLALSFLFIFGQISHNGAFFIISPHKIEVCRYLRKDPLMVIEKPDICSIRYFYVIPSQEFILKHNLTGYDAMPDVSVTINLQNGQKKILDVAHAFTYNKEDIIRYYQLLEIFMKYHYSAQSNQGSEK